MYIIYIYMYIRHEIECIHIHLYIYSDISIYIYTFMYIRACVWIHHKAIWLWIFSKHPGDFTFGTSPTRPTATACERNWMPCAFVGCLRTPVGGWKKRCRWWVIWAFRCRRLVATFQHTKLLQQLLFRHSKNGGFLQAELAGKTVRAMEGVGSTDRFVFAFFHGPKCWNPAGKKGDISPRRPWDSRMGQCPSLSFDCWDLLVDVRCMVVGEVPMAARGLEELREVGRGLWTLGEIFW